MKNGNHKRFKINSTSDYGPTLEKYFPGQKYLYRNLSNSALPEEITIFVEADSLEAAVEMSADQIYNYLNDDKNQFMRYYVFEILYNSNFNEIKDTKDYIVSAVSLHPFLEALPMRIRNSRYWIKVMDKPAVITDLTRNPDSYASQVRNAILSNPHISLEFYTNPDDPFSRDELKTFLQSAVKQPGEDSDEKTRNDYSLR